MTGRRQVVRCSATLKAPAQAHHLAQQLETISGVREAVVFADEGIAYLKVDTGALDERALNKFLAAV